MCRPLGEYVETFAGYSRAGGKAISSPAAAHHCSSFHYLNQCPSGAVQVVSKGSTELVASKAHTVEAGNQDVDRDLADFQESRSR